MNLYLVECQGMTTSMSMSQAHGKAYVLAPDPHTAYSMLKSFLDNNDLGYPWERELKTITLVAQSSTLYGTRLLMIGG